MPRRLTWALLAPIAFVALALAPRSVAQDRGVRAHVRVVVLERFPERWLAPIEAALEEHLEVEATVEPAPVPLPSSAWYAPRRRYRAEILTDFLAARSRDLPRGTRVLGLTSRDISTSTERFHDWGILGLADAVPGRAAVVSSFRMRRRARSDEHALFRTTTTAVHEVGHVLGLPHCTEARCIMRDAEGTMDTVDRGDGELGASCRALLDRSSPVRR